MYIKKITHSKCSNSGRCYYLKTCHEKMGRLIPEKSPFNYILDPQTPILKNIVFEITVLGLNSSSVSFFPLVNLFRCHILSKAALIPPSVKWNAFPLIQSPKSYTTFRAFSVFSCPEHMEFLEYLQTWSFFRVLDIIMEPGHCQHS